MMAMRFVITAFLALLLWGSASFAAGDAGIPKWIPAVSLLIVGVVIQLVYAHLVPLEAMGREFFSESSAPPARPSSIAIVSAACILKMHVFRQFLR